MGSALLLRTALELDPTYSHALWGGWIRHATTTNEQTSLLTAHRDLPDSGFCLMEERPIYLFSSLQETAHCIALTLYPASFDLQARARLPVTPDGASVATRTLKTFVCGLLLQAASYNASPDRWLTGLVLPAP